MPGPQPNGLHDEYPDPTVSLPRLWRLWLCACRLLCLLRRDGEHGPRAVSLLQWDWGALEMTTMSDPIAGRILGLAQSNMASVYLSYHPARGTGERWEAWIGSTHLVCGGGVSPDAALDQALIAYHTWLVEQTKKKAPRI